MIPLRRQIRTKGDLMRFRFLALPGASIAALLVSAVAFAGGGTNLGGDCLAHHPNYIEGVIEVQYTQGCTGHDEPELFPVSSNPGSARNLTSTSGRPSGSAGSSPIHAASSDRRSSSCSSIPTPPRPAAHRTAASR